MVSLRETDNEILTAEKGVIGLAVVLFLLTSTIIFIIVLKFVSQPVKKLIDGTRQIARGELATKVTINQDDEMGQLATAVNLMAEEIGKKTGRVEPAEKRIPGSVRNGPVSHHGSRPELQTGAVQP